MGTIGKPQAVKLFAGIIAVSGELAAHALEKLEGHFGPIDVKSPVIPFVFTDYYAAEMGEGLVRQWAGFKKLIDPERLAEIKRMSNDIETGFSVSNKRRVNIDPGYITPAKVVLASSKDFSHRVYLSGGIYGEVTLMYKHKAFAPFEWTYPDYKSETAREFFVQIRKILQEKP